MKPVRGWIGLVLPLLIIMSMITTLVACHSHSHAHPHAHGGHAHDGLAYHVHGPGRAGLGHDHVGGDDQRDRSERALAADPIRDTGRDSGRDSGRASDHEVSAPSTHAHWATAADAACSCVTARRVNGWCGACGTGYVAGTPITSAMLHEALDPHGHVIDPASMACASCHEAMAADGYCPPCGWGFVDGQLYFSRLTWSLAKGTVIGDRAGCAACRRHADRGSGWCDACRVGVVGNVAFGDHVMYDIAAEEHRRLARAIALSARCELCGVAMFMNARCPECANDDHD